MKIELSDDEVKEILRSWVHAKLPWVEKDAAIAVHQLHYEGSLDAGISVETMAPSTQVKPSTTTKGTP